MCLKSSSDFLMLIPSFTVILLIIEKWQLYFKGLFYQRIFLSLMKQVQTCFPFSRTCVIISTADIEMFVCANQCDDLLSHNLNSQIADDVRKTRPQG